MRHTLKITHDFGITCEPHEFSFTGADDLLDTAKKVPVRWVIVDEKDKPIYWSHFIQAAIDVPPRSAIATDDPYVTRLATEKGVKVLTTAGIMRMMGMPEADIKKTSGRKPTAEEIREAFKGLEKSGIEVMKSNLKDNIIYGVKPHEYK